MHGHCVFDTHRLFDCAAANFESARTALAVGADGASVLLLTETRQERFFHRMTQRIGRAGIWQVNETTEPNSLLVRRDGGSALVLIAGQQLLTSEGLEVLAVGTTEAIAADRPIAEVVAAVQVAGALPIVPWGFGKWWFRRGRVLTSLLETVTPECFFLGDNGGRLQGSREPALFAAARQKGIRVLPGSDPLPFRREVERVGSCGFAVPAQIDLGAPAAALKRILTEPKTVPQAFGDRTRLSQFVRNQLLMQLRKRAVRRGG